MGPKERSMAMRVRHLSGLLLTAVLLGCVLSALSYAQQDDVTAGQQKSVSVVQKQAEDWAKGSRRAFVVGISDYKSLNSAKHTSDDEDLAYDVKYADRDAEAVRHLLEQDLGYDSVICLTNGRATREAILQAFAGLVQEAKPFDTLFVYLSGHGFRSNEKTYFMPYDAVMDMFMLRHQGIALEEVFADELRGCAADHKLLVLDCCHAGAATGKALAHSGALSGRELEDLAGRGLYVLASCRKDEFAYENPREKHGFFTKLFVDAIQDGRADEYRKGNRDGLVSADEVYYYLYDHLSEAVRSTLGKDKAQTPQRETPEVGETLIARTGRLQWLEVPFSLDSDPDGAQVLIDGQVVGVTPLKTNLELGRRSTIVVAKESFSPWSLTLVPYQKDPVVRKAVLIPEGSAGPKNYDVWPEFYDSGDVDTAFALVEKMIAVRDPQAPESLLFLVNHWLQQDNVAEAERQSDRLRQEYGVLTESAEADQAVYEHYWSSIEDRSSLALPVLRAQHEREVLTEFMERNPDNRFAEEAARLWTQARDLIQYEYGRAYSDAARTCLALAEIGQFQQARTVFRVCQDVLVRAEDDGVKVEVPQDRTIMAIRTELKRDESAARGVRKWHFNYADFSLLEGLKLVGNAEQDGDRLLLTSSRRNQRGAAWYTTKVAVDTGFQTTFRFRISRDGGDGFAFVVQNHNYSALGIHGGSLGYGGSIRGGRDDGKGIPNSIAVEFDIWNSGSDFPDGGGKNHISVNTRGELPNSVGHKSSLGSISDIRDISDGRIHTVQIVYDTETMKVFLDNLEEPVLTVPVHLPSRLQLDDGRALVGFTAATGASSEEHEIISWLFQEGSPS